MNRGNQINEQGLHNMTRRRHAQRQWIHKRRDHLYRLRCPKTLDEIEAAKELQAAVQERARVRAGRRGQRSFMFEWARASVRQLFTRKKV